MIIKGGQHFTNKVLISKLSLRYLLLLRTFILLARYLMKWKLIVLIYFTEYFCWPSLGFMLGIHYWQGVCLVPNKDYTHLNECDFEWRILYSLIWLFAIHLNGSFCINYNPCYYKKWKCKNVYCLFFLRKALWWFIAFNEVT